MRAILFAAVSALVFVTGSTGVSAAALTNQLKAHPSPYLALHGTDPVAWQDWNEAAVARARREGKLLYLSIGYFSCHWCHVMQRESYRNGEIARYLNDRFVPVKIDRELEPALDARLSEFAESTRGMSGWPLNVFLTPDGHPLYALLYAPPAEFLDTLKKLQDLWLRDPDALRRLARAEARPARGPGPPRVDAARTRAYATNIVEAARAQADTIHGGFGEQSKFPSVPILDFLLAQQAIAPSPALAELLTQTLDAMAQLGLRDHIGGGFFRYTVDPGWKTPHFEKMLYDNAMLARLYLRASEVLRRPAYAKVARETFEFMRAEMRDASGAFVASLSALDANGVEGGYYLWDADDLAAVLDERERAVFRRAYGMNDAPPFEAGYLPIPAHADITPEDRAMLEQMRAKLRAARAKRELPRDTKRLAGWNGLALAAFADAARHTGSETYRAAAREIRDYLLSRLWDGRRLRRAFEDGRAVGAAALEDYAYVAEGLLAWAKLNREPEDYQRARTIVRTAWSLFYTAAGWRLGESSLLAAEPGQDIVADGPLPSPSAVLIDASLTLGERGDAVLRRRALAALNSGHELLQDDPFWYATHVAVGARAAASTAQARKK